MTWQLAFSHVSYSHGLLVTLDNFKYDIGTSYYQIKIIYHAPYFKYNLTITTGLFIYSSKHTVTGEVKKLSYAELIS